MICRSPGIKSMVSFHLCRRIHLEKSTFKIQVCNTCTPFHFNPCRKSWPFASWSENEICYFGSIRFYVQAQLKMFALLFQDKKSCNQSDSLQVWDTIIQQLNQKMYNFIALLIIFRHISTSVDFLYKVQEGANFSCES